MLNQGFNLFGGLSARGVSFLPTADQMRGMTAAFGSRQDQDCEHGNDGLELSRETAIEIRQGFVRKVYMLVLTQLLLTFCVAGLIFRHISGAWVRSNSWALGLSMAMCFGSLCAIMCCGAGARKFPQNYFLLYGFTVFAAVTLGLISSTVSGPAVVLAVLITLLVFVFLTFYACITRTSFAGYAPYMFAAFDIVATFGFALWMMSWCFGISFPWMVVVYDAAGVALFTFYIVFDTQRIIGEWGGHSTKFVIDDYAYAALSLYIDIINLFMHLLSMIRYFVDRMR